MDIDSILELLRDSERDVFVTILSDEVEIPFYLLSSKQAERFSFLINATDSEVTVHKIYDFIFQMCCIDKDLLEGTEIDLPAGIADTIGKLILLLSGMGSNSIEYTESLWEGNRLFGENIPIYMKRTVCSVFKSYTFEDLDRLSYPKIAELFIRAEETLMEAGIRKEPFKLEKAKSNNTDQVDINTEMKKDQKDLAKLNGPPEFRRLERS